jgi:rhodanese-related sulfurtransferase
MQTIANIPQITPTELKARLDNNDQVFLLDVREPHEREICSIGGELIPKGSVSERVNEIPRDKDVIVYCRSGARSQAIALELARVHGFSRVFNLAGGVLRWSDEVDPSVTKY